VVNVWLYPSTRKFVGRWSIFIVCNRCIWKFSCSALIFIMVGVQDIKFAIHAHPMLSKVLDEVLDELLKSTKVQSI